MNTKSDTDDLICKVCEFTNCSLELAKTALYDCDNDVSSAIAYIFEHGCNLEKQWLNTGNKSKSRNQEENISVNQYDISTIHSTDNKSHIKLSEMVKSRQIEKKSRTKKYPCKHRTIQFDQKIPITVTSLPGINKKWSSESVKIINSDSNIALETCAISVNSTKPGDHKYDTSSDLFTSSYRSKKPMTATVSSISMPVTVSNIANENQLLSSYISNKEIFPFFDQDMFKISTRWLLERGIEGESYLVPILEKFSTNEIISKSALNNSLSSCNNNIGLTTDRIVEMLSQQKQINLPNLQALKSPFEHVPNSNNKSKQGYGTHSRSNKTTSVIDSTKIVSSPITSSKCRVDVLEQPGTIQMHAVLQSLIPHSSNSYTTAASSSVYYPHQTTYGSEHPVGLFSNFSPAVRASSLSSRSYVDNICRAQTNQHNGPNTHYYDQNTAQYIAQASQQPLFILQSGASTDSMIKNSSNGYMKSNFNGTNSHQSNYHDPTSILECTKYHEVVKQPRNNYQMGTCINNDNNMVQQKHDIYYHQQLQHQFVSYNGSNHPAGVLHPRN